MASRPNTTDASKRHRMPKVGEPLPAYVVWLPTAAPRYVNNLRFKEQRAAAIKARADSRFRDHYRSPGEWDAERERKIMADAGIYQSAELALLLSIASASPLATQACVIAFGTTDFRADLARFDVPTLVAHGDADRIVPFEGSARQSHALISGSRLEVLAGAPHGFTATHAASVNALLIDFLRS